MKCPATLETSKGILHCQRVHVRRSIPHERHEWRRRLAGTRYEVDGMGVSHEVTEPPVAAGKEAEMMVVWTATVAL